MLNVISQWIRRHFSVRHFHDHIITKRLTRSAQHCTKCMRDSVGDHPKKQQKKKKNIYLYIYISRPFWTILWASQPHRGVGVCFQGTALSAGPSSMNLVPPAPQNGAQMGPNDSIGRYSKVSNDIHLTNKICRSITWMIN